MKQISDLIYILSVDQSVINLALIFCHRPDKYFNIPCVPAPKLFSIMSAAIFQFCKTSRIPLMQMSTVHSNKMKIWHSDCHLCICSCRLVLFIFDCSWLTDGFFPICVKACGISRRTSWPVCGQEHWGMRAEASYQSVIPCAFDGFRCKCTVTLC